MTQAAPTLLLLQHETRLYLVDLTAITMDLFYQLALRGWEGHKVLTLEPGLEVEQLLRLALQMEAVEGRWQVGDPFSCLLAGPWIQKGGKSWKDSFFVGRGDP